MNELALLFAKLAGVQKSLKNDLDAKDRVGFPIDLGEEYYRRFFLIRDTLIKQLPDLYGDMVVRDIPKPHLSHGKFFALPQLQSLYNDMDYMFEVRANSELAAPEPQERPHRIFVSHGRSPDWREVQAYIEKDLGMDTLELAQEANRGRTVLQKLDEESASCSFAVVVMTGDDEVPGSAPRVRENVMHEIGYFQGKYGLANVCLLHEEGVNIPTNIHGVVYIPFPTGLVRATFGVLHREVKAAFK